MKVSRLAKLPDYWDLLMDQGCVNVTGLPKQKLVGGVYIYQGIVLPELDAKNQICSGVGRDDNVIVVRLPDGTVWEGAIGCFIPPSFDGTYKSNHVLVPCLEKGEFVNASELLKRNANPLWNGGKAKDYEDANCTDRNYFQCPATLWELKEHPEFIKKYGVITTS